MLPPDPNPMEWTDWHWAEPCWPARRYHGHPQAGALALKLTLFACFDCKQEFVGPHGIEQLHAHQQREHPGQPARYLVYPPAIGVRPKGGDG